MIRKRSGRVLIQARSLLMSMVLYRFLYQVSTSPPTKLNPHIVQKFSDTAHSCITLLLDSCCSALHDSRNELKSSLTPWTLWIPEPQMIIGLPDLACHQRYV